jgi:hypothetical protein
VLFSENKIVKLVEDFSTCRAGAERVYAHGIGNFSIKRYMINRNFSKEYD